MTGIDLYQFRFILLSTTNPVPFPPMRMVDIAIFQRWCAVQRMAVDEIAARAA